VPLIYCYQCWQIDSDGLALRQLREDGVGAQMMFPIVTGSGKSLPGRWGLDTGLTTAGTEASCKSMTQNKPYPQDGDVGTPSRGHAGFAGRKMLSRNGLHELSAAICRRRTGPLVCHEMQHASGDLLSKTHFYQRGHQYLHMISLPNSFSRLLLIHICAL